MLLFPIPLPTSLSPYQPHCPSHHEKWWRNGHRKLLGVIFLEANPSTQKDPDSVTKLLGNLWRREVFTLTFIFLGRKLMWVDEVWLHLTEKSQEDVGLSQSNINLSHHLFSTTPNLSIGDTQELRHICTYKSMQWLYKSLISRHVC